MFDREKNTNIVLAITFLLINFITIYITYLSCKGWDQWGLVFAFETLPFGLASLGLMALWIVNMAKALKNKKMLLIIIPLFIAISVLLCLFLPSKFLKFL